VPLVLAYHGYTATAEAMMSLSAFQPIADTAGFIVVYPQGTLLGPYTHWNVGGWTAGSTVDDVGFTEALIDSISAVYNVDPTRVYSTGSSNGGYMSFLLACQLSERIAAIASIAGSMTPETFRSCSPQHPTPILQMHGTADDLVPYDGESWTLAIDSVIQYWVDHNNCKGTAITTALPDLVPGDGSTVEHVVHEAGDNGVSVEHFRIIGGGHDWPGALGNMDINASEEIWRFFSRYDINGLISPVAVDDGDGSVLPYKFELNQNYPNPFNPGTTIEYSLPRRSHVTIEIHNVLGQKVRTLIDSEESAGSHSITWDGKDSGGGAVSTGVYLYRLRAGGHTQTKKMLLLK